MTGATRQHWWDKMFAENDNKEATMYYSVQGDYGYGHGWEEVCAEDDLAEARKRRTEYRENEPGVAFRIRKVKA